MMETFELTNYNFYSSRLDMELITTIVDSLKEILEEDKKEAQPLFLKVADDFIMNIARRVVQEKKKTFLIGITGESASGKTVFVDNTIDAVVREKKEGIYTVIRQDDYYKDTSKELEEAGSYDALFKTGFSFDTPDVINLQLMREHLLALKNSETIVSPHYDFVTCVSSPDGEIKKPAKVILTEGLYVLNEGVRDIMDVKVYVFTPFEKIKEKYPDYLKSYDEVLNEFQKNSYEHKITFYLRENSKLYLPDDYYVGRKCQIETKTGVKESLITAIEREASSGVRKVTMGKLKVTLTSKLRGAI